MAVRPTRNNESIIRWLRWEEQSLARLVELVSPERRRRLEPMLADVRERLAELEGTPGSSASHIEEEAA